MAETEPKALANLVAERRSELNLSVDDLASELDVTVESVQEWERGQRVPEPAVLMSLARALRLPRSLVIEAGRRAADTDSAGTADIEGPPLTDPQTDTVEEPILVGLSVMGQSSGGSGGPGSNPESEPLARAAAVLVSPFRALLDRFERRRLTDRAPTSTPSYLEDPKQRLTYSLRAVFTAGGVVGLILVLRWALGRFGSALSDVWETVTNPF